MCTNDRIEERIRKQKEDPVIYNDSGNIVHLPDWAYDGCG